MGRGMANERSNHQHFVVSRVEHIETNPAEVSETPRHFLDDASLQTLKRYCESLEGSEFVKKGVLFDRGLLFEHISRSPACRTVSTTQLG